MSEEQTPYQVAPAGPSTPATPRFRLIKRLFGFPPDVGLRFCLQDQFFKKILRLNPTVPWPVHFTSTIGNPEKIKCGRSVYPGDSPGVYINAKNGVEISDFTNIGPNVGLISANHDPIDNRRHVPAPPIRIGRFCWLGMGAIVLPGVELGDFTIIGAGAVVTKSFPDGYCVLAGNPAVVIRQLDEAACRHFAASRS